VKERRKGHDARRSPGSGDVLTLRTRSLIGDDLWRHSIFRPSSKGNRRNKYGHRYVLPISRAHGVSARTPLTQRGTDVFTGM